MIQTLLESFQELIYPSSCLNCGEKFQFRKRPLLCDGCLTEILPVTSPFCPRCGQPFQSGADHYCGPCLQNMSAFDLGRSAVHYREPVTSLISSLKFSGILTGLATLAHLARHTPAIQDLTEPDIVVPVPLHITRLRKRKFNQALLLSHACFPEYKIKIVPDLLLRNRPTVPQTSLNGVERRRNLSGAFSLKIPSQVSDKTILLVDDVFTTGSTVNECAKVLRKAGAKRIEVFTVARAG